jgi:transposase
MNPSTSTLPDDPESLKRIIAAQQADFSSIRAELSSAQADFSSAQADYASLKERYEKDTELLLEQIRHLRAQLFGRKSEKGPDGKEIQPLPLFDMPEPDPDAEAEEGEAAEDIEIPVHTRKKRGRKPLPEELPRVEVVHDLADEDKVCACGCDLSRIGEEVSEQLDIVPAQIRVIRNIRPKYACRQCEGVEDEGPTVSIAPAPPTIIPKSIVTPSLLAHVLTGKFVDAVPFYRQEGQFRRLGIDINRTSMCNWAMKAAEACTPLLNLLEDEISDGDLINIDETPVQVLVEPGRDPTTKSYMWIFRRGDPEKSALIYQYHPTRSGKVAAAFLRDFSGYVQTDGYSGYDFLDDDQAMVHVGCWAHVRRKFKDVIKAQGKNRKKNGSADVALNYIGKLYRIEQEAKKKNLTPEEIYKERQQESAPILEKFREWLLKRRQHTPPKGLLGKAITYAINQWDRLEGYLRDGRISMDNNAAENSIRPFVVGRKNWLFAGTAEGAAASAVLYSLVETAKANGLEPYSYFRHIFDRLPKAQTLADLEALLPWNLDRNALLAAVTGMEAGG